MAESTSYFFDASYGSIYPALKRLEEKALIISEEQVTGGKFKKIYSITEEGRAHFLIWLEQPVRFFKTKLDYLVPFFFYEYLEPEMAAGNMDQFIKEADIGLSELKAQKQELDKECPEACHTYHYSVLAYGISYYEGLIAWCTELAARSSSSASKNSEIRRSF